MANWIYNWLTMTGDVGTIATIVESHFQIEPRTRPDHLPDICVFRGLNDDPDNLESFDFGFQLQMGSTKEESETLDPNVLWDGTITSPFFIFWVSKWGGTLFVPETLDALYPDIFYEYDCYDPVERDYEERDKRRMDRDESMEYEDYAAESEPGQRAEEVDIAAEAAHAEIIQKFGGGANLGTPINNESTRS